MLTLRFSRAVYDEADGAGFDSEDDAGLIDKGVEKIAWFRDKKALIDTIEK